MTAPARPQGSPQSVAGDFEALLARGAASAAALATELGSEREALRAQDLDALAAAAAAKQRNIEELEALETERRDLLSRCGLADDGGGMQAFLQACDPALQAKWQHYLDLAADCRRENLTNGAIIRLRHQQLAAALSALSGGQASAAVTYAADGSERPAASRSLAEA